MESTIPMETTAGLSINIHAPCNNIVVSGEHAAVTIHFLSREAARSEDPEGFADLQVEPERVL